MLRFKYTTNSSRLDLPYHIYGITSDTESVEIKVNGNSIGFYKPNMTLESSTYNFSKFFWPEEKLLQLLITGSRQEYSPKENEIYFNKNTITFVKLENGLYLYRHEDRVNYSWEENKRSRFYFNPKYFNSEYLWKLRTGYVPTKENLTYQWPKGYEQELFLPTTVIFQDSNYWYDKKSFSDVEPLKNDYFSLPEQGPEIILNLTHIIELDLKNGDSLEISNGKDTINTTVNISEETSFNNLDFYETDRPLIHVEFNSINPNKLIHYSQGLLKGSKELIQLNLYGSDVQFNIRRI